MIDVLVWAMIMKKIGNLYAAGKEPSEVFGLILVSETWRQRVLANAVVIMM